MFKKSRNVISIILVLCIVTACSMSDNSGVKPGSVRAAEIKATQATDTDTEPSSPIIEITESSASGWGIQLTRHNIKLEKNREYRISFDYDSDERGAIIRLHKFGNSAISYFESVANLTPESNSFSIEFLMEHESDSQSVFVMELSRTGNEDKSIAIKNFEIVPTDEDDIPVIAEDIPMIHVDQLGYISGEKKYAVIISDDPLFAVYNAETDKLVFNGRASEPVMSYSGGENVRIADFSSLFNEGEYYIKNSESQSYSFTIDDGNNYKDLMESLLGMYENQKCGNVVNNGRWSYEACHTDLAYIYGTNETLNVSGGWHSAGDYGRYVIPMTKAIADILLAYELGYANDSVLETARYGLEWLLKMQNSISGAVYHKVTAETISDEAMPNKDTQRLVISPISATATADFAAITAMAARIYADEFGNLLLNASRKAWHWLEANPNYPGFKNPEGITTTEYGDDSSEDERFWAACELFHTTGEDIFHNYIKGSLSYVGFGLADMGFYGSMSYLNTQSGLIDVSTMYRMEAVVKDSMQQALKEFKNDPYMISLGLDYSWGSNMDIANNAMLMVFAVNMIGDTDYLQPIREHIHYLLGRNPLSQSYITGFGTRQALNPYHILSEISGKTMPGMLVSGPNSKLEDPIAAAMLKNLAPAKTYIDNYYSYSTNEVALHFNSPLYFVLSFLNGR